MKNFDQDFFKIAVIVDMQEDFMDKEGAALPVPGANEDFIDTMNQYLESLTFENGYVAVVFTADTHNETDYPESAEAKGDEEAGIPGFPPHCYQGTDGFKFAVTPGNVPNDNGTKRFILNKPVFSMWESPKLIVRPYKVEGEMVSVHADRDRDEFFQGFLDAGIVDVDVVGVASDYCVNWAISGLVARGFRVTTYDNLVAGIEKDIYQVVQENFPDKDVQII